jgi:hypothetical protein
MGLLVQKIILLLCALCLPVAAYADNLCDVPVSEWQPLEKLRAALAAMGLRVTSIAIERGCYYAQAVDSSGHEIVAFYDPATLVAKATGHGVRQP